MQRRSNQVLIINEFAARSSPTGELTHDLHTFLNAHENIFSSNFYISKHYKPGGIRFSRIVQALFLNILLPFRLFVLKISTIKSKSQATVICVTTPPLTHWMTIIWGRLFGLRIIVWYQDAHPEFEIRILNRLNLGFMSKALQKINNLLLPLAHKMVTLDSAMKNQIEMSVDNPPEVIIAPPWVTYIKPAKALRLNSCFEKLRLIYAGNYGAAHDLTPLVQTLTRLADAKQKTVEITFVGMGEESQTKLKQMFRPTQVTCRFLPRHPNKSDLLESLYQFDFGIVSLRSDYRGLACPSKAYTYISQGLPILYIGPEDTLSHELVSQNYGVHLSLELFDNPTDYLKNHSIRTRIGQILEDPSLSAKRTILASVENIINNGFNPIVESS